MTRMLLAGLLGALLFLSLTGCQQSETVTAVTPGVEANQAYRKNFGEPPHPKAGRAFARVGYLPLSNRPEQVRAMPLFLFSHEQQLQRTLDYLIGGQIVLSPDSPLYQPFPSDLQLAVIGLENGSLTLALTTAHPWQATDLSAAVRALTETALQFDEVTSLHLLINGQLLPQMPAAGYTHTPGQIAAVEPPKLLTIVGSVESQSGPLIEILIEFDRPVTVNRMRLTTLNGQKVAGKYFTSMFDMAVVVQPETPQDYPDGTSLKVEWDVTDRLGRTNTGTDVYPLQYHVH